ncbi:hypothetical protein [Arcanobacterium ihumii]|uniref:hypothetical protein n=1 Tax=Arcanobacterium ihumii TaxID=2138162 RepID=UPI000F539B05|nr:hypothetical protein [Arcanobacterium ihumii]
MTPLQHKYLGAAIFLAFTALAMLLVSYAIISMTSDDAVASSTIALTYLPVIIAAIFLLVGSAQNFISAIKGPMEGSRQRNRIIAVSAMCIVIAALISGIGLRNFFLTFVFTLIALETPFALYFSSRFASAR